MTKDLPTKEGYYWWMVKGEDFGSTIKSIVRVRQNEHKRFYTDHGSYDRYVEDWQEGTYWQYIPEPEIP